MRGLVAALSRWRSQALAPELAHFLKVTRSYWSGLFHCYDVPDLPRTNNDLEHVFAAHRYHERRGTGRQGASPTLVVRGSVSLIAAQATRHNAFTAGDLARVDLQEWRRVRVALVQRQRVRVQQRWFGRDPRLYLKNLENRLNQLTLPA